MCLWSWRHSKHHIQHEHTHIYLYTDFQNCCLIHCGTLRAGPAPVPGDSIAVGLKLSPLTLIHVCFQTRCQGSRRMVIPCLVTTSTWREIQELARREGGCSCCCCGKEGWGRYQNWAETLWACCPEPEPSLGRASDIPYGGTGLALWGLQLMKDLEHSGWGSV